MQGRRRSEGAGQSQPPGHVLTRRALPLQEGRTEEPSADAAGRGFARNLNGDFYGSAGFFFREGV